MIVKNLRRSFAGGEIAPEMFGQFALTSFQTGLALCKNFITLPHGPLANRAGFQHIKECKDGGASAVRLFPFIFNDGQAYVLEFGHQYVRFHTEGATILTTAASISGATQANPVVITAAGHGYSDGDEVYHSNVGGMTELNNRFFKVANKTTNTYELTDLQGNNIDGTAFSAYSSGGNRQLVYEIATPYSASELFKIKFEQDADVVTLCHPSHAPRELKRLGAASWSLTTITFGPGISAPVLGAITGPSSGAGTTYYAVTSIDENTLEESLVSTEGSRVNDLSVAGNYNQVSWTGVSGAIRYNVYKRKIAANGTLGFIGQTSGTSFVDDNILPDFLQTPPEDQSVFNASGKYPEAVTYDEQRRTFGGATDDPLAIHMSRSGTQSNFSRSIPSRDDDAIAFALRARQYNRVRHLIPAGDLIALTSAGAFRIFGTNSAPLTPSNLNSKPQAYIGASHVRPIITSGPILFTADKGGHAYDFEYNFESDRYRPRDVSIIAPHLFETATLVDWDITTSPYQIVFGARSDGALIGLTYLPDQEPDIIGWHQHATDGDFESATVIPESNGETMVYAVVKRKINGTERRFIERMHSRKFNSVEEAFFVDAGLSLDNPITITGATQASPVVITAASHGIANGETFKVRGVVGMTELNQFSFTAANVTANTIELKTDAATPVNVDGTGYTAYESGGTLRKEQTAISNLHHLEGKSVSILADGNVHPKKTVANGAITLDAKASIVHAGLGYNSDATTLPLIFEGVRDFGEMMVKDVLEAHFRVKDSRGFQAGPNFDRLKKYNQRTNEKWDEHTRLMTGKVKISLDGDYTDDGAISVRQSDPLPLTILNMGLKVHVGD